MLVTPRSCSGAIQASKIGWAAMLLCSQMPRTFPVPLSELNTADSFPCSGFNAIVSTPHLRVHAAGAGAAGKAGAPGRVLLLPGPFAAAPRHVALATAIEYGRDPLLNLDLAGLLPKGPGLVSSSAACRRSRHRRRLRL